MRSQLIILLKRGWPGRVSALAIEELRQRREWNGETVKDVPKARYPVSVRGNERRDIVPDDTTGWRQ